MRIIAGELGGRVFTPPKSPNLRPTTDRVRESVFSMLEALVDWPSTRVIDLFAGSGALAFEALSRGALLATVVEEDKALVDFIADTAQKFGVERRIEILTGKCERVLPKLSGSKVSLVLADPPYDGDFSELPNLLLQNEILNSKGVFVFEHSPNLNLQAEYRRGGLSLFAKKYKKYGDSAVTIFVANDHWLAKDNSGEPSVE